MTISLNRFVDRAVTLYETDYLQWIDTTLEQLRDRHYDQVDWENLCAEIEDMSRRECSSLASNLAILLLHLLKWQFQPEFCTSSWQGSIFEHRLRIVRAIEDSPSLSHELPKALAWAYPRSRRQAGRETGLALATFPEDCPYRLEEILDEDFWPEIAPA